ncbi:MAG: long-chain-fatty-acid--CoA ligase [Thermoplasmatales archaeon]|nr:MAG: long-chain-fatty-acid--CoA ligase [Thermoplasmatales archaeon]
MNLTKILPRVIKSYPEKKAVVCSNKKFTYRQFGCRVGKLANTLLESGIKKGDKVAVLHKNCHYYLESYFGIMQIGASLVPLNHHLSAHELAFILKDSETRLLIADINFSKKAGDTIKRLKKSLKIIWTGEDYEDFIASAPLTLPSVDVEKKDVAQIYYTSGTTGRAKGVVLSHKNVYLHALCTITELCLKENDVWLHAAPLFHLADAWATWAITLVGGTHVISSDFDPKIICKSIEKQKVTLTNLVPTMYYRLVNYPKVGNYDYSTIRVLLSGGAPISPNLVQRIIETFKCDYIQTYGMTETSPFLTMSILKDHLRSLPYEERFRYKTTTGREFMGVELKVINEKGAEVKRDNREVGEIIVKGETITNGYWKMPQETEKVFKNRWLYTGDMAVIDAEGYVTIVDRKEDMIITGGENVYSIEVENVLYMHPSVLEAAIIGIPDEEWGEIVKAIVVLHKGKKETEGEIIEFCKGRIAAYKVPKSVEFTESLPKLGSGKISKKKLKNRYDKESRL